MFFFNACPKCQDGTLRRSWDEWGDFVRCVNCGTSIDLPENVKSRQQTSAYLAEMEEDRLEKVAA